MRALLIVLLVVVVLAVVGDRLALAYTERQVAAGIQESQRLPTRPDVEIEGVPFLTQAAGGRYERVVVEGSGFVGEDGTRVERLRAVLTGAQVPLSELRAGTLTEVPVERVEGEALLTFADLEARVGRPELDLSAAGNLLRVTGAVTVLGRELSASADSAVAVEGERVVVTAERFSVGNGVADELVTRAAGGRLDFGVEVTDLPYGLVLREVRVTERGLVAVAAAEDTVLAGGAAPTPVAVAAADPAATDPGTAPR